MNRKKILSLIISAMIALQTAIFMIPAAFAAKSYQRTFIITAYYSPLPNQQIYLTGSFEGDKRVNGNGIKGADRVLVYEGMIAAPPTYDFGTKIDCAPFFSGEVHDRGGAIVKAGMRNNAYDRLDIWTGAGEEALKKALAWGKRTLTCAVSESSDKKQYVNLPESKLSLAMLKVLKTAPSFSRYQTLLSGLGYNSADQASWIAFQLRYGIVKSKEDPLAGTVGPNTRKKLESIAASIEKNLPKEKLEFGAKGEVVRNLQEALIALQYFKGKSTAHFGVQTKSALIQFQIDQKLISGKKHPAAGYVGPGTIAALKKLYAAKPYLISKEEQTFIEDFHFEDVKTEMIAKADELAKLKEEWLKDHDMDSPEEKTVPHPLVLASASRTSEIKLRKVQKKLFPVVIRFSRYLSPGERHPLVKTLQTFLKEKGYFKGEIITENFGKETLKALIQFQIEHGLIASEKSPEAGILGPKTLKALNTIAYTDLFSAPFTTASSIRGPAIDPEDLKDILDEKA